MSVRNEISQVVDFLNNTCFEREDHIDAMIAAAIAKQHVFLLGPPGTAKTMMINKFVECFADDVRLFYVLMMRESKASEVFGMPSIPALKEGRYEYAYDGFFPTAHFAILDEIFKANSGTLNGLLTAINERKFMNGNNVVDIPLISLFCASNELPADDSLQALYDRIAVRKVVPRLMQKSNRRRLVKRLQGLEAEPDAPKVLTLEVLEKARQEVEKVEMNDATIDEWLRLQKEVERDLASTVYVSDRRWQVALKMLKALVWVKGGTRITNNEFIFLVDMLWEDPSQRAAIMSTLHNYLSENCKAAKAALDKVVALKSSFDEGSVELDELFRQAKKEYDGLKAIKTRMESEGASDILQFDIITKKFTELFTEIHEQFKESVDGLLDF